MLPTVTQEQTQANGGSIIYNCTSWIISPPGEWEGYPGPLYSFSLEVTQIISTLVHWPEIAIWPHGLRQLQRGAAGRWGGEVEGVGCETQRSVWIFREHYAKCLCNIWLNPTSHACTCTAKRGADAILWAGGDIHGQEGLPIEEGGRQRTDPGTRQHCWVARPAPVSSEVSCYMRFKTKENKIYLFKPL